MTDTKVIISLVDNVQTVLEVNLINKVSIPVIAVKVDQRQTMPSGVIDLETLINPAGWLVQFECVINY